ncbi:hypothetical protein EV182_007708, partial [Spiromyces aspiralis]
LHGSCNRRKRCPYSHDIEYILECREREQAGEELSMITATPPQLSPTLGGTTILPSVDMIPDMVFEDKSSGWSNRKDRKKRRRQSSHGSPKSSPPAVAALSSRVFERCHSASFDAFMTAYVFVDLLFTHGGPESVMTDENKNTLFLTSKDVPLKLVSVQLASTSKAHQVNQFRLLGANGGE